MGSLERVDLVFAEHNEWKLPRFIPTTTMEIKNLSTDKTAAFKIKTTEPFRYNYYPTSGFIDPGASVTCTVTMERGMIELLVQEFKAESTFEAKERYLKKNGNSRDKFLIKYCHVSADELGEGWLENTKALKNNESEKVMIKEINRLWERADENEDYKGSVTNTKIRLQMIVENHDQILKAKYGIIWEDQVRQEKQEAYDIKHYMPPPPKCAELDKFLMKGILSVPIILVLCVGVIFTKSLVDDNNTGDAVLFCTLFFGVPICVAWVTCGLGNLVKRKLGIKVTEKSSKVKDMRNA